MINIDYSEIEMDYLQEGLMEEGLMEEEGTNSTGIGPSQSPTHSNEDLDQTNPEDEQRTNEKKRELKEFLKLIDLNDPKMDDLIAIRYMDPMKPEDGPNLESENREALRGLKTQLKVKSNYLVFEEIHSKFLNFSLQFVCKLINLFR